MKTGRRQGPFGPSVLFALIGTASAISTASAGYGDRIPVGFKSVDSGQRQVVRTSDDRVYVFAQNGAGVVAYKGDRPGFPIAFAAVGDSPTNTGFTVDVRLDEADVAHVVYRDPAANGHVIYRHFDTHTDTWSAAEDTGAAITQAATTFGDQDIAIVLDDAAIPHVVFTSGTTLATTHRTAGAWTSAVTIATGSGLLLHPTLGGDPNGVIHVAWLDKGGVPSIRYASRTTGGAWSEPETVASSDVDPNTYQDQSPSLVVTDDGIVWVVWIRTDGGTTCDHCVPCNSCTRVTKRTGANSWQDDSPGGGTTLSHDPALYAAGNEVYVFLGHDAQTRYGYFRRPATGSWSNEIVLDPSPNDGSASVRWDPKRPGNQAVIDTAYFGFSGVYYMAVQPESGGGNLTLSNVVVKGDGGAASGRIRLRGTLVVSGDPSFDGSTGVSVRVQTGAIDWQKLWSATQCRTQSRHTVCASGNDRARAILRPGPGGTLRFAIRLRGVIGTNPVAAPVMLTVSDGAGASRHGSIATCVARHDGSVCSAN